MTCNMLWLYFQSFACCFFAGHPRVKALNSGSGLNTWNKILYTIMSHFVVFGRITHRRVALRSLVSLYIHGPLKGSWPHHTMIGRYTAHFRYSEHFRNLVHLPYKADIPQSSKLVDCWQFSYQLPSKIPVNLLFCCLLEIFSNLSGDFSVY